MPLSTLTLTHELSIEIGGLSILVRTDDSAFARMIQSRYGDFLTAGTAIDPVAELDIELMRASLVTSDSGCVIDGDAEVSVRKEAGRWIIERGDFRAEWDPECRRGWVRQTASPYALDGVLRILHSLILARGGGFLVHAASGVRKGRAYVFAGVSGAGKTTLARLAPPDVILLSDEISYIRPGGQVSGVRCQVTGGSGGGLESGSEELRGKGVKELKRTNHKSQIATAQSQTLNSQSLTPDTWHLTPAFSAFGTPFAGELARLGQKIQATLSALFLLEQGLENRTESLTNAEAARELLRHVLFFAHDEELVRLVFLSVCEFVKCVPVRRLTFTPDARVWELIA